MGLPDVPVHVTAIKLHGNKRTKAEVILAAVCDVEKASTAQELLERLAVARANLSQLGIFESAEILVDTHSGREVGTGALDTKLVVDVKEKKHFEMKLETGIDPNAGKGSAEASVTMTNRFGRAERIFASSTQNASHGMTRDYKAGFFLPSMINSVGGISADISQTNAAYPRCSYDEEVSELTMRAGLPALPLLGQQTVWAGVAMRQLSAGAESSFKIKEQCSSAFSTSTKCFLGYTLQHDDRDDAQMPTDGSAWRCSIEAAAKDVAFIKPELKFQYNRPNLAGAGRGVDALQRRSRCDPKSPVGWGCRRESLCAYQRPFLPRQPTRARLPYQGCWAAGHPCRLRPQVRVGGCTRG